MQNQTLAAPKRVLLLDSFLSAFVSFGRDFSPWAEFTKSFRIELECSEVRPPASLRRKRTDPALARSGGFRIALQSRPRESPDASLPVIAVLFEG
jgi:hypothetical protein